MAALTFSVILMITSFSKAIYEEREEIGLKVRPYSKQEKIEQKKRNKKFAVHIIDVAYNFKIKYPIDDYSTGYFILEHIFLLKNLSRFYFPIN